MPTIPDRGWRLDPVTTWPVWVDDDGVAHHIRMPVGASEDLGHLIVDADSELPTVPVPDEVPEPGNVDDAPVWPGVSRANYEVAGCPPDAPQPFPNAEPFAVTTNRVAGGVTVWWRRVP